MMGHGHGIKLQSGDWLAGPRRKGNFFCISMGLEHCGSDPHRLCPPENIPRVTMGQGNAVYLCWPCSSDVRCMRNQTCTRVSINRSFEYSILFLCTPSPQHLLSSTAHIPLPFAQQRRTFIQHARRMEKDLDHAISSSRPVHPPCLGDQQDSSGAEGRECYSEHHRLYFGYCYLHLVCPRSRFITTITMATSTTLCFCST